MMVGGLQFVRFATAVAPFEWQWSELLALPTFTPNGHRIKNTDKKQPTSQQQMKGNGEKKSVFAPNRSLFSRNIHHVYRLHDGCKRHGLRSAAGKNKCHPFQTSTFVCRRQHTNTGTTFEHTAFKNASQKVHIMAGHLGPCLTLFSSHIEWLMQCQMALQLWIRVTA
jgi:hypothetical protein